MGIKQKISILLTLVFVLVAVGCGGSNSIETQKKANVSEQTSTHKMEEEKQSPSVASTPKVVTHILGASRQEVDALMKSKKYRENKEIHDDNEVYYRLRNYNGTLVKTITRDFYNESGGCCRCFQ